MGFREVIQGNRGALLLVVVLLALSVVIFSRSRPSKGGGDQRWFYDLQAGKLFAHSVRNLPPVTAPSGGEGVLAHVYACGECTEAQRTVVYLEKYTDAGKAWAIDTPTDQEGAINTGHLIGLLSDTGEVTWVVAESRDGNAITERIGRLCPDQRPTPCRP